MSARQPVHPDAIVHLAVRQARYRISHPEQLAHLSADERSNLFKMAWAVLKSAQGCPTAQRIRATHGGDAA